jgi:hypothetical protein
VAASTTVDDTSPGTDRFVASAPVDAIAYRDHL